MAHRVRIKSVTDRAIQVLREGPRVEFTHLRENPGARTKGNMVSKSMNKCGKGHKELQLAAKPPLGWIFGDWYKPWQRSFPAEPLYNKDIHLRREYPPLSLLELQRLIDLGWVDTTQPIDLTTLCNTKQYRCDPLQRQFGVQLTDEGTDCFAAKVNIEVQWASELAIASVERNGGVITTAYYDPASLVAAVNPLRFFQKGEPIPRRAYPPADLMPRYIDAKQRGYLADPQEVQAARQELAQKYGYIVPDLANDALLTVRKHPQQVFLGLQPGWVVNLHDKSVLKPKDSDLLDYYAVS